MTTFPLKIKRFIQDGEIHTDDVKNTDQLLERAGHLLDKSYSHDIVGQVMFEADNSKIYVMTVEAIINEANPDYVKKVLDEIAEEKGEEV